MLQRFTWTDDLKVGVPTIDVQHKELVATANDLAAAIEEGRGSSFLKKLLTFMKYYAEWHFEQEERCAAAHQCPAAEMNCKAHAEFIRLLEELQQRYRQDPANESLPGIIHKKLADWLVNHIMKVDKQIGQYICARQAIGS
ncbi:MAG: hemerythrin family protein [Thermostichus sp. DG02_5_bins_236]